MLRGNPFRQQARKLTELAKEKHLKQPKKKDESNPSLSSKPATPSTSLAATTPKPSTMPSTPVERVPR